jgi:hypothetical protein
VSPAARTSHATCDGIDDRRPVFAVLVRASNPSVAASAGVSQEEKMDWLSQVTDIMDRYGSGDPNNVPGSVDADFDRFSRIAPSSSVSEGLAEAFRSRQTPPFASMLSQLFGRSPSNQKTNVLNTLIATLGPALVSQLLAKHGANRAAQELQASGTTISPEVVEQIPANSIEEVAAEAETRDPSIVDRISKFYAEQPALIKTLGGLALTVAMAKVAQRQTQTRR